MPTIVLATGNPHKVEELRAIFAGVALPSAAGGDACAWPGPPAAAEGSGTRVIGLKDLPGHERYREPEEIGVTFEANARIKARSYAEQIGREDVWCLADDSGIEIDALKLADGTPRPGVISSHYSSDGREMGASREARDAANNARVLRELEGVASEKRAARFVCSMCLVDANGRVLHETRGTMEGRIGVRPRVPSGSNGFGYDPLFLVAAAPFSFGKTGAELSSEEKNRLSHRGMAGRGMVEWVTRNSP